MRTPRPDPRDRPRLPLANADGPLPFVMHLRSSNGFWGPERVIFDLARARPDRAAVVCFADRRRAYTELLDRLGAAGVRTATVPSQRRFDPGALAGLVRVVQALRPDLVHAHDYKSDTVAALSGRFLGVPVVATAHNWRRHTRALRLYARIDQVVLRSLPGVAAVSEEVARTLRERGARRDRVHVIHNGVDTREFSPRPDRQNARAELGVPPDGPLIAVGGRLSPEKGIAVLLRALADLVRDDPYVRLAVAGEGELAGQLAEGAARLGVGGRVHWLGCLEQPRTLYCAADVYAQPSLQEGLPLTLLEAAACGAAIVATAVGDVPKVIMPGETGILVPPGDAAALAGGIRSLLAEPATARRLASAARLRVTRQFDVDTMRAAYRTFYAAALAGRGVA